MNFTWINKFFVGLIFSLFLCVGFSGVGWAGEWPSYPCPPDSTSLSAVDLLSEIKMLAEGTAPQSVETMQVQVLVLQCMYKHSWAPYQMSTTTHCDSLASAKTAAQASDWQAVIQELDHPE